MRRLGKYNAATRAFADAHREHKRKWNPVVKPVKDGLSTEGLSPPTSNWALPLEEAPLLTVTIACGITFTFGGLSIDPETASVLEDENQDDDDENGKQIPRWWVVCGTATTLG